jgi:alkanesulfonate monooxygenase SsuD/methylene tetrahydromethanopterin reductase-like flavin-dependent oxidoreductase (luciferase family)
MRFGLILEADGPAGFSLPERYDEVVQEALLAEELGYDFLGVSEQHFNESIATISAPETFLGYLAARTERARLRFTSAVLLAFNHPLRVAERLAVLDILSHGRAELGTARSNNPETLSGFGVDPKTTRAQWTESMELIIDALTNDVVEYDGEIWKVPGRRLVPKAVQQPHPPIYVSATSLETHRNCGLMGLGVMSGFGLAGWDYVETCLAAYRDNIGDAQPRGGVVNDSAGCFIALAHCAPTREEAMAEARESALRFVNVVSGWFKGLSPASPDYEYFKRIDEIMEHIDDLDHLVERSPYISIGDPDFLVDRFRRLEEMGYNELILRIEGMGHERNMQAIGLIGREVMPKLQSVKAA